MELKPASFDPLSSPEPSSSENGLKKSQQIRQSKVSFYIGIAAVTPIILGIVVSSPRVFFGFLAGIFCGVALLLAIVYYLLNLAEYNAIDAKNKLVAQKLIQPVFEGNAVQGSEHGGFLQISSPNTRVASDKWLWGDIKSSMLFYQDMKGHSKGVLSLANCRMLIIKTRAGRLWRNTNYLRLVSPDRALLGEYRECVLFFRNGKEMEEWSIALKSASQLNQANFLENLNSTRQIFSSLMKKIGYDWENDSIPNYRPASLSPVNLSPQTQNSSHSHQNSHQTQSNTQNNNSSSNSTSPNLSGKANDDSKTHGASKWFNMLVHRIFSFLNDDPGFVGMVKKKIAAKLDKLKKPSILKSLELKEIKFGPHLPIVSDVSIHSATAQGDLKLDCKLEYQGNASADLDIVIDVELLGKHITTIPATLNVVIKKITGKCQVAFSRPPSDIMWFGFYTEPEIELEFNSFIGQKHRLINIPKLTNIIVYKLKQEIVEMMLLPDMDDWDLPKFKVPKGQTRIQPFAWEYQAGYVPPPKKRSIYDSSSDEEDEEMNSNLATTTTTTTTTASTSSQDSSLSISSFIEIPQVSMKNDVVQSNNSNNNSNNSSSTRVSPASDNSRVPSKSFSQSLVPSGLKSPAPSPASRSTAPTPAPSPASRYNAPTPNPSPASTLTTPTPAPTPVLTPSIKSSPPSPSPSLASSAPPLPKRPSPTPPVSSVSAPVTPQIDQRDNSAASEGSSRSNYAGNLDNIFAFVEQSVAGIFSPTPEINPAPISKPYLPPKQEVKIEESLATTGQDVKLVSQNEQASSSASESTSKESSKESEKTQSGTSDAYPDYKDDFLIPPQDSQRGELSNSSASASAEEMKPMENHSGINIKDSLQSIEPSLSESSSELDSSDRLPSPIIHRSSAEVQPPPIPPRTKTIVETGGDPLTSGLSSSGFLIKGGSDQTSSGIADPFSDIFAPSNSYTSPFDAALRKPPPELPARPKKTITKPEQSSFPKSLYAEPQPNTWSSSTSSKKESVSLPSASSVKSTLKNLFNSITGDEP